MQYNLIYRKRSGEFVPRHQICHPERAKRVEGSSHCREICSQFGAKILRLRALPFAQDDRPFKTMTDAHHRERFLYYFLSALLLFRIKVL